MIAPALSLRESSAVGARGLRRHNAYGDVLSNTTLHERLGASRSHPSATLLRSDSNPEATRRAPNGRTRKLLGAARPIIVAPEQSRLSHLSPVGRYECLWVEMSRAWVRFCLFGPLADLIAPALSLRESSAVDTPGLR